MGEEKLIVLLQVVTFLFTIICFYILRLLVFIRPKIAFVISRDVFISGNKRIRLTSWFFPFIILPRFSCRALKKISIQKSIGGRYPELSPPEVESLSWYVSMYACMFNF